MKVAKCENRECTGTVVQSVEPTVEDRDVGLYTSVAISSSGTAIISYYDRTNDELKVTYCGETACTQPSITSIERGAGMYTSIAIGSDRLALISYYDQTNGDLKVVHCGNETSCKPRTW